MTRKIFFHICAIVVFVFTTSQNIYTSGSLAYNVEEASSEIPALESLRDEKLGIYDFEESVLKANEPQCKQDKDCYHAGKCITKGNIKECECKNGTSGPFCQEIEECVSNSDICGKGKDVQCVFDVVHEKAVCKCNNFTKKFDTGTETCRVPCEGSYYSCGTYGNCHRDYESDSPLTFCWCRKGVSGDRCEIIDKCVNKEVDCGKDPTVTCELNSKNEAYCKCNVQKQVFDDTEKLCKDCDCGPNSMYCSYKNGTKSCVCKSNYFFDGEKCEDCKCGEGSLSCSIVNGSKVCECYEDFKQRFDQCALCDCWKNGENCTFSATGKKQCDCYPGYTMNERRSCAAFCNSTHHCQNGGTCNKVCQCPKGTRGDFCEKVDWCDYYKCGFMEEAECLYNRTSTEGYCKCKEKKHYFEETTRRCYKCDCGDYGKCILAYDAKVCICDEGYSDYLLNCKRCDCGYNSVNCSFKSLGYKLCQCKDKYAQKTRVYRYEEVDATCAPCDCGEHGKCRYENEEKVCECEEHYKIFEGECKECFCGYDGYCDFNSTGEKTCHCDKGFSLYKGVCIPCSCNISNIQGDIKFDCHFTNGVKHCDCPDGFEATVDSCEDIDECLNTSACHLNTICKNLPGTYKCECKPGFQVKDEGQDPKDIGCEDINECKSSGACQSNTCVCINSPGSYDCVCKEGYYLTSASHGGHYNPKYNQCYAKEYAWRNASITIGIILAVGIILVSSIILYRKSRSL